MPDVMEENLKLIKTKNGAVRVSQACDRCRIKKIRCDGLTPCHNCSKVNFECKTSDKLTRRAFPKGYTENLERKVKQLEEENMRLKGQHEQKDPREAPPGPAQAQIGSGSSNGNSNGARNVGSGTRDIDSTSRAVQINNPIDQIFNLDSKGIIIGNDNLNFESQFNHLLINLNLPFLKITNSHNFLLNDPNSYLYHPSYTKYNRFHNRDLDVIYNPLTANNSQHDDYLGEMITLANNQLPIDIYDFFIKLINNFKKIFNSKRELDNQIIQYFINYNVFIPIFDYKLFMESYDAFHTMYPFMFTYDDATINGFNILNNDYHVVNEYLMVVVQIYAMIMMNDPTINLNLLLNHSDPNYVKNNDPPSKSMSSGGGSGTGIRAGESSSKKRKPTASVIRSLYDFLPYFNVFHVSVDQLQTYLLFLYYSLITNNKEKSLVLSSLINSFIGILGINLNSKSLFFNDLTLTINQRRTRVKIFWCFKILLKVFNLKFGFKPSLNTTVINPVTIDRYFELTPAKLQQLLEESSVGGGDELFTVLLKPSVEFLNLVNIIIPSSFSPNYYQYLKGEDGHQQPSSKHSKRSSRLDWILNDDDGDGNDGNLNYNFTQFLTIDRNLTSWRETLKEKELDLIPLQMHMNLPVLSGVTKNNLYHSIPYSVDRDDDDDGRDSDDESTSSEVYESLPPVLTPQAIQSYLNTGLPDTFTASELIKVQLNFHFLLIRSMNYLNFVIDKELTSSYYRKIREISREVLAYFLIIFQHVGNRIEVWDDSKSSSKNNAPHNAVMESLGLDVDEDGFVINDFSVKRRRISHPTGNGGLDRGIKPNGGDSEKKLHYELPKSPFNYILNGLSMTIINFKKSIILQMLYLLICSLKMFKKGDGKVPRDIKNILIASVDLFVKVFINYNPEIKKLEPKSLKNGVLRGVGTGLSSKESKLFGKLINDELKDEILKEPRRSGTDDSDEEDSGDEFGEGDASEISQIDWDDEEMDEDLKYLKILKFIKYKINNIYSIAKFKNRKGKKKEGRTAVKVEYHPQPTQLPQKVNTPQAVPMSLYSAGMSPRVSAGSGSISKMPSLTKFDFLLGEGNYSGNNMHTNSIAYPVIQKLKEFTGDTSQSVEDLDLKQKERLAVNDLMSLKNQHKGSGSPFQTQWSYEDERK